MTASSRFIDTPATVLVVEDHEDSRELLVMLLADAGYRVAAASNAYDALEQLRAGGITFVVTDYNLEGGETGGWLLETAAELGLLDDVGVALYSALPNISAPARLSRVIVYRKPLDTDALLADVARAIARPSHRGLRVLPPISA